MSIYSRTQIIAVSGQILVSGGGGNGPTWYQAIDSRTDNLLKFLSKLGLKSASFLNTFTVAGGGNLNFTATATVVTNYTVPTP